LSPGSDPRPEDDLIFDRFVREQSEIVPKTVSALRAQLRAWPRPDLRRLVLVGSGTSLNALIAAKPWLETAQRSVDAMNPGVFMRCDWAGAAGLLVCVLSQTGTSETSVAAFRHAEKQGLDVIVLTAERDSPIGQASRLLHLPVGPEPVGPKSKGYSASLASLFVLADWLDGRAAGAADSLATRALDDLLAASTPLAAKLAAELDEADFVAVIGSERHYGTALEGSLKIAEMAGLPAAGFPLEEALHGRLHGLSAKSLAILIAAGTDERRQAAQAAGVMAELGVKLALLNLTSEPTPFDWVHLAAAPPAPLDTIAAILPLQRLAEALARRRGIPPHRMRFPGLSQRLGIKIDQRT
jgi:fructoselysine-6-P-deglycase FrlB-like protein